MIYAELNIKIIIKNSPYLHFKLSVPVEIATIQLTAPVAFGHSLPEEQNERKACDPRANKTARYFFSTV